MRPNIDMSELIRVVEDFEKNQAEKILGLKADTKALKDFLTIDESVITKDVQNIIDNLSKYIDENTVLYQKIKSEYNIENNVQNFMDELRKSIDSGILPKDIGDKLLESQNFKDVVTSSIVGQFPKTKKDEVRFNNEDFNKKIQIGAKSETLQIIRRMVWASQKSNNNMKIDIDPVGSTAASEDIIISFKILGPRGGSKKAVLREDVKVSMDMGYLKSGKMYGDIEKMINKAAKSSSPSGKYWYIKVDKDELYNIVAKLLGEKYGVVYYQDKWRANAATFFTSPDGSIELGSELLSKKDFELVIDTTVKKIAIRRGYIK